MRKELQQLLYLSIGKDSKLPSSGIVPQRSLLDTSLHNGDFKLADKSITSPFQILAQHEKKDKIMHE